MYKILSGVLTPTFRGSGAADKYEEEGWWVVGTEHASMRLALGSVIVVLPTNASIVDVGL